MGASQVDRLLIRGPRPKKVQDLLDIGVGSIISLQSGFYTALLDDAYELEQPIDYDIRPFFYPLSDFYYPDPVRVAMVLTRISHENLKGHLVYLHCKHGVDRTGYIIAAYRMTVQGWSYKEAVAELYEFGFHRFPYEPWVKTLKKYERKIIHE